MIDTLLRRRRVLVARFARLVQRFETRLLLIVAAACTAMALGLFTLEHLSARGAESRSDTILKLRLSSPPPARNVVIVDIDERSLALLSEKYGAWPWSRELPAEALQKILDAGARAVLFGVMMSDPDRRYPEGDLMMETTAAIAPNVAYPMIRLNPANDSQSQLRASSLPGAMLSENAPPDRTLAAILPWSAPMRQRMGVADQRADDDGLVRSYPLRWVEEDFTLPSIAQRTLEAGGVDLTTLPDRMTLNWRNKRGSYLRLSFADVLSAPVGSAMTARLRDAFVVVGVSAPGIGLTKATAVRAAMDDNEILATAIDDALNRTYLRTPPEWLMLLLTVAGIWLLVFLAIRRTPSAKINRLFVYAQGALMAVMLLGASYANYLIDLSGMMSFLIVVFAGIKLVCTIGHAAASAVPGYREPAISPVARHIVLIGLRSDQIAGSDTVALERSLCSIAGLGNVIRIDDLFGGHNFLARLVSHYVAFVLLVDIDKVDAITATTAQLPEGTAQLTRGALPACADIESEAFKARVARLLLQNAADLFAS